MGRGRWVVDRAGFRRRELVHAQVVADLVVSVSIWHHLGWRRTLASHRGSSVVANRWTGDGQGLESLTLSSGAVVG